MVAVSGTPGAFWIAKTSTQTISLACKTTTLGINCKKTKVPYSWLASPDPGSRWEIPVYGTISAFTMVLDNSDALYSCAGGINVALNVSSVSCDSRTSAARNITHMLDLRW